MSGAVLLAGKGRVTDHTAGVNLIVKVLDSVAETQRRDKCV